MPMAYGNVAGALFNAALFKCLVISLVKHNQIIIGTSMEIIEFSSNSTSSKSSSKIIV
jgi:hypothetical protein